MKKVLKKNIASSSRWLHIYLSMFSFIALLFFAVTGITLNHTEWFTDQQHTTSLKGEIPKTFLSADTSHIKKLEIVEFFRNKHKIKAPLKDFIIDEYQCIIAFKGPGYGADIFLDREKAIYELSETSTGLVGMLNDLHKGRDTSVQWKWLIDVSAMLMVMVSLTGLIMLFFLKKKRIAGLMVIAIGGIITYLIYLFF
jgi:uncharacterized protein